MNRYKKALLSALCLLFLTQPVSVLTKEVTRTDLLFGLLMVQAATQGSLRGLTFKDRVLVGVMAVYLPTRLWARYEQWQYEKGEYEENHSKRMKLCRDMLFLSHMLLISLLVANAVSRS